MSRIVLSCVALYLIGLVFIAGYIVGVAKHWSESNPADTGGLPLCSEWGFLDPRPHKPNDPWLCQPPLTTEPAGTSEMRRDDI